MKKRGWMWLIVALALLLALPGAVQAEMYGEVYLGGVQGVGNNATSGNFSGTTNESGTPAGGIPASNWQNNLFRKL